MAKGKDYKSKEDPWAEYLSSIEKPEKQAKKGPSIGETLKRLLESIGIGKEKKTGLEEIKKQVAISAEEAKESAQKPLPEKQALKTAAGTAAKKPEEKAAVQESEEYRAAEEGFLEKSGMPSKMEKYLEKVEEKRRAEEKERALEEFEKKLEEKKAAEEKPEEEKRVLPKKALQKETPLSSAKKKVLPEAISQSFFSAKKKVLLLPAKEEKAVQVKEKVALMPKAGKEKAADAKKAGEKKPVQAGKKAAEEKAAKEKRVAEKKPAFESKEGRVEKKPVAAGKVSKGMAGALVDEKDIAVFFRPASLLAGKSVEEIKKLSPKEIRKELDKEKIEDRARGWYGDVLRHKKAAVSGWRLRKKVKLHQLKKKEKRESLSEKENKTMKELVAEDRALRNRIGQLDHQIRSVYKIASEKKKKNQELEKKIRAIGVVLPEKETLPAEGGESQLKKGERIQLVETMKRIADEMTATAARESMASFEVEEAMPIEDGIRIQESMIKSLERAFYKRKIDFDQFREKMFDYQSKLTEMKIRKKINDEKMKNMTPEMRLAMEKRIAAGEAGKRVGISPKTAEALEKIAEEKSKEKEIGAEAIEAIKKIAEKQAAQAKKETGEKGFAEKTVSLLERISEKLGNLLRGGASQQQNIAGAQEATAGQQPPQPTSPSYQGGIGQQTKAYGKETQIPQAQPDREKGYAAQGAQAAQYQGKGYSRQQGTAATGAQPNATGYQGPAYQGIPQQYPYQPQPAVQKGKAPQQADTGLQYKGPIYQQPAIQKGKATKGTAEKNAPQQADTGLQYQGPADTGLQYKGLVYKETPQPPEREAGGMPRPAADFYEDEKPQKPKKGFFVRLRGRVSEKPASMQPVGKEIDRAIREKAAHTNVNKKQIDRIEKKLGELLERYSIPEGALADHIKSLDEGRLIEDFQKLINLIEDKRENSVIEFIRPAPGFDISSGVIFKKKEKIEGTEKEIRRTRIETSFDRVLALVQIKGIISLNDVAIQLGMSKEEVQQCSEVLERSRLINLNYPPIGPVKLIYPAYLKWKAEAKKKEAEEKKWKKEKK